MSDHSKLPQRLVTLAIALVFAFGLVVPVYVLAHNGDDKAGTDLGVHLSADQQTGRELFSKACVVCHTLAAVKSVGHIGPNLDYRVGKELNSYEQRYALVLNAITEGRALGRGDMPALLYQGKEAEDVASFVAAVAGH